MSLSVKDSVFRLHHIDPTSATLIAPGCPGFPLHDLMVYSVPLSSECGTKISYNETHIIYQNVLKGLSQMF